MDASFPHEGIVLPRAALTRLGRRTRSLLIARRETVAVAETTAGGLLASLLAVPPAPSPFVGGVIAYGQTAKTVLLGMSTEELAEGAVSPMLALALARAACQTFHATWGVAETGIAGPQLGRRSHKPAGLAYVAVVGPVERCEEVLTGRDDRMENQRAFAAAVLSLLEWQLHEE